MTHTVMIEDIAGRRRRQGIEDTDLIDAIRCLAVGDGVRITLRYDQSPSGETVTVRITEIGAVGFQGALVSRPISKGLGHLGAGYNISFTANHIHSLADWTVHRRRRPDRFAGTAMILHEEEQRG
jgi:hypothetical protein